MRLIQVLYRKAIIYNEQYIIDFILIDYGWAQITNFGRFSAWHFPLALAETSRAFQKPIDARIYVCKHLSTPTYHFIFLYNSASAAQAARGWARRGGIALAENLPKCTIRAKTLQ